MEIRFNALLNSSRGLGVWLLKVVRKRGTHVCMCLFQAQQGCKGWVPLEQQGCFYFGLKFWGRG